MQRNASGAGGRSETTAELIARITAEQGGDPEPTGRHGAVALLRAPERTARRSRTGRHSLPEHVDTAFPAPDAIPAPRRHRRLPDADAAAAAEATVLTQDTDGPRRRWQARRMAPLAVGAVVVVLATVIAMTVRPAGDPATDEPELSAGLVDPQDPSVTRVGPDDVTGATGPPPAPDPSAEQTVGPDRTGPGAPFVDDAIWLPVGGDEFTTGLSPAWTVYDDARRSPAAVSVQDGVLVVRGDATGRSGGLAWTEGSRFGRWEMRARFPQGDPRYHPALLLWPTDVDWPAGGEIDLAETASSSDTVSFFLHHGAQNAQLTTARPVDITQWHDYAVEWTPDRVTAYLDGQKWFESTDPATIPPGDMQAAVQLDWFPGADPTTGPARPTEMQVDHVRLYR